MKYSFVSYPDPFPIFILIFIKNEKLKSKKIVHSIRQIHETVVKSKHQVLIPTCVQPSVISSYGLLLISSVLTNTTLYKTTIFYSHYRFYKKSPMKTIFSVQNRKKVNLIYFHNTYGNLSPLLGRKALPKFFFASANL